jgi:signal transduction histidine kinase
MDESPRGIREAVAAVGSIDAVRTLLAVVCETTGLGFAAVARVTDSTWTACAVRDDIGWGITPGGELAVGHTICFESRRTRAPIVIEHASFDERYRDDPVRRRARIESYCSAPIILADDRYFGTLCALDRRPTRLASHVVPMISRFATLIASQLDRPKHLEQERAALLDERAASELREQFIAILGHDLRNPLQAVYASADVLIAKLADPAEAQIAARIKTNARRMSLLIDDVLDFARGRLGGGIDVDLTDVDDINSGILSVIQEFKDAQPECQISADIQVDQPVRCDLGRLQQVASNLLANALTHGRPHTPVSIKARADTDDLVLDVWNAGEPIPPQSIDKIFEPFWRHSVSASRNGLGLGLHICAEIVRAHGGRLFVTSTANSGTQFTARLPLSLTRNMHVADPMSLNCGL